MKSDEHDFIESDSVDGVDLEESFDEVLAREREVRRHFVRTTSNLFEEVWNELFVERKLP